jgi:hypothetical protein
MHGNNSSLREILSKAEYAKHLPDIRCDLSQHIGWRRKFFDNPDRTKFEISAESLRDTFPNLVDTISSKNLRYTVEKENGDSVDSVLFKFYPTDYPDLTKISLNNPESR